MKKFDEYEVVEWDGKTPLYVWDKDKYLYSESDADEYCEDNDLARQDLKLKLCEPVYLSTVPSEYWNDELPEGDDELPAEMAAALTAFNEFIGTLPPTAWMPGHKRVILKPEVKP